MDKLIEEYKDLSHRAFIMNVSIVLYPRVNAMTIDEFIKEYTRQLMAYYLSGGPLPPETNQATPEVLNALYGICYPKSHIQKLYERGELIWY